MPKPTQLELAWEPKVSVTTLVIPQANGEFLVKVGKPVVLPDEIGTREAARILGLSQRQVQSLVDSGAFQYVNRPGQKRGKYFLSRAEVLARKTSCQ
jgi:hypothetical protein